MEVQAALQDGFTKVPVETWLAVLPQIIARIHSNTPAVRKLISTLLVDIGRIHPQVPNIFSFGAGLEGFYFSIFFEI